MEIKQLKTFTTIAKTLSFSKTAQILNFAQSSISDQIKSLEEELECRLFERLGKSICLTKEGEELLSYAHKIIILVEEAKQNLSSKVTPSGTLTIATAESLCVYLLPKLFTEFSRLYPQVDLKIIVGKCEDFAGLIKSNKVDIAYTFDYPMTEQDFIFKTIQKEPLIIVSSPCLYPKDNKRVNLYELDGKNLVLTQRECSYRIVFEELLKSINVQPNSILELESIEAIKQYVKSGFGVSFLPKIAVQNELESGELIEWDYRGFLYETNAQYLYHKDKWLSPALKALIDLTDQRFNVHNLLDKQEKVVI